MSSAFISDMKWEKKKQKKNIEKRKNEQSPLEESR